VSEFCERASNFFVARLNNVASSLRSIEEIELEES
jgi:hypothetical protein